MRGRADWVDRQIARRGIRDARVLSALRDVPRERFVPAEQRAHAYDDAALSIGFGQTISQPYVVALICAALELRGDERVLDVGTGSGYQAAVLARLAREVVSIERIPELAAEARARLADVPNVEVLTGDGTLGVPDRAPYDAIAVAAAAAEVPPALAAQVRPGGALGLPLGEVLVRVDVSPEGRRLRSLAPVRFVPLVAGPSGSVR